MESEDTTLPNLILIDSFAEAIRQGVFTPDDGIGYYATEKEESKIVISFDRLAINDWPKKWTHVSWYNK